jgi:hypothetical protein
VLNRGAKKKRTSFRKARMRSLLYSSTLLLSSDPPLWRGSTGIVGASGVLTSGEEGVLVANLGRLDGGGDGGVVVRFRKGVFMVICEVEI